jgi:adenylosuccinate lyase
MNTLCPLDGRYKERLAPLLSVMGENAFTLNRVRVECAWWAHLPTLKLPHFKGFSAKEQQLLTRVQNLQESDFQLLRDLEFKGYQHIPATKHDVKAVEYFLKLKLKNTPLADRLEFLHFALTSEDVNSVAYALLLSDGLEKVLLPALIALQKALAKLARKEARGVMLARTHGQPAVPTTFGKEMRVFEVRLARQIAQLKKQQISCKFSGAVGNFNAHAVAFPRVNWPREAQKFINKFNESRAVKIYLSPVSTQVDNRDSYAELFDNLRRINTILLDFCRDMWQYISSGKVVQKTKAGEVGSSTMPQKVNPIDFENAEGNLQLASALFTLLSQKLPVSRLQRDLSDSTTLRNMPVSFGYALLAYGSILKGLNKIAFDKRAAREELSAHPEVLAEALQTILRANGVAHPYETLRDFTRGKKITAPLLCNFINTLQIDQHLKERLQELSVEDYIGLAVLLAEGKYD